MSLGTSAAAGSLSVVRGLVVQDCRCGLSGEKIPFGHQESKAAIHETAPSPSCRDLTQNRLRGGVLHDVEELIMAIGDYVYRHNQNPKPFIWTAKASDILEKVEARA
jgi:hypothetical protein